MNRASSNDTSNEAIAWSTERPKQRDAAVVLWATDGSEGADGALRVAAARAKATGATLELLTVVQPDPVLALEGAYSSGEMLLASRDVRRHLVEAQVARVLGPNQSFTLTVADGNPAYTISRIAVERRASMVVVGLGRHFIAHRLFGDETALQLARIARVPVLAVPSNVSDSPRHAVVAIDFSDIATRAAQTAIDTGASRHILTATRRLGAQLSTAPAAVRPQSIARQRARTSPAPANCVSTPIFY